MVNRNSVARAAVARHASGQRKRRLQQLRDIAQQADQQRPKPNPAAQDDSPGGEDPTTIVVAEILDSAQRDAKLHDRDAIKALRMILRATTPSGSRPELSASARLAHAIEKRGRQAGLNRRQIVAAARELVVIAEGYGPETAGDPFLGYLGLMAGH